MPPKRKEAKENNYREIARPCIELIGRYLLTLGNIQDRVFFLYFFI